jgi:hypothetical protein
MSRDVSLGVKLVRLGNTSRVRTRNSNKGKMFGPMRGLRVKGSWREDEQGASQGELQDEEAYLQEESGSLQFSHLNPSPPRLQDLWLRTNCLLLHLLSLSSFTIARATTRPWLHR